MHALATGYLIVMCVGVAYFVGICIWDLRPMVRKRKSEARKVD